MSAEPIDMSEFDFRMRRPGGVLARFVESIWYARGTVPYQREQIAPTGSCVAVFVLGPPIREAPLGAAMQSFERGFLIGPHERPVVNEPTGETHAVGIVCTTVGATPVLGVDPNGVKRRVVDLESAWPAAMALRAALATASEPDHMLGLVE
ncbi:MAG: DUF6597 domain-containing transcriptional factor, partial [Ilumatobacter sp.]